MITYERRFRLTAMPPVSITRSVEIHQVYWRLGHGWSLRIRQENAPDDFLQTIALKGPRDGSDRPEVKVSIFESMDDSEKAATLPLLNELLKTGQPYVIDKTRSYFDDDEGVSWELDEFHGRHSGLIIAEVHSKDQTWVNDIPEPSWAALEVTPCALYNNENLAYEDCSWIQQPF